MTSRPDAIIINVARDGNVAIGGEEVSLVNLKTRLENARKAYAEQAVLIRGDSEGMYQAVVDVMNVCHQAKIRFSLAFQPTQPGAAP